MKLVHWSGNLFAAADDAVVIPVNTLGVAGAGLAKQWKERFPASYQEYREACRLGVLTAGRVLVTQLPTAKPKYAICFPTKTDWRLPSKLDYIRDGLVALKEALPADVKSVAIPHLGCGLGRLRWADVEPLIIAAFCDTARTITLCDQGKKYS